ncbi:ArsR family transcriptional regulator [Streptomyces armeniacus]|uniref:ArsR family transcriptional regulator n=1 Tax=Streptomyces armeniacus TaxID=83291 RepID=A0A345XJG5_9ACTN|nr:helix-turn-helix domain-containing protein [Streptomyces armeniacus]AXK31781.1 ArsR family transcriptional regulator [Streptomyces armeniacus]
MSDEQQPEQPEQRETPYDGAPNRTEAPGAGGEASVVLDAKGLRALAHPVRVQLVGLLRKYGPSTATRLAERLGVNSGTASYHLRQLDAAGFVEEDTERGNARERWWRSVHQLTRLDSVDLIEQEPEATLAYLSSVAATDTLRAQRALNELQTMPRPWRESFDMSSWPLLLTADEAAALQRELHAVADRYRRDPSPGPENGTAEADPAGAERVTLVLQILPELDVERDR